MQSLFCLMLDIDYLKVKWIWLYLCSIVSLCKTSSSTPETIFANVHRKAEDVLHSTLPLNFLKNDINS